MSPSARAVARPLALVLVVLGLSSCGERVEVPVEVGFHGEAKRNPFLALERFCAAMGVPAIGLESYDAPPRLDQVLFAPARVVSYGGDTTETFLAWVKEGGHALVHGFPAPPAGGTPVRSPLLEALRVAVDEDGQFRHALAEVRTWTSPTSVLERSLGAGSVTLIADAAPFANGEIGTPGHAALWWELVRSGVTPSAVVFVRGEESSWLGLALRKAWPVAVSLLVLALSWIVARAARFGPLVAEPVEAQRAFVEHVRASGRYLASIRGADGTVRALRGVVLGRLRRRRPDLAGLDDGALGEAVAGLVSLPATECRAALTEPTRPRQLHRRVEVLLRMLRTS